MKFYDALREMQEHKARCRVMGQINKYYFWGDVLDVPCLKNSLGEEVLANSWIMNSNWEVITSERPTILEQE